MERLILNKLLAWKNSPYRKPLILKGVRQVGKTISTLTRTKNTSNSFKLQKMLTVFCKI